jgi:hypothetical protein
MLTYQTRQIVQIAVKEAIIDHGHAAIALNTADIAAAPRNEIALSSVDTPRPFVWTDPRETKRHTDKLPAGEAEKSRPDHNFTLINLYCTSASATGLLPPPLQRKKGPDSRSGLLKTPRR